jgi:hypothetical protein
MDFCYHARLAVHDSKTIDKMTSALERFEDLREVFRDEGVRTNFALPRQHALFHYTLGIRLFGSLNGLCSSLTESKHICAVKEPWRRSNRRNPLRQILLTNTRLNKAAAARSDFGSRGLLDGDVYTSVEHDLFALSNDSLDEHRDEIAREDSMGDEELERQLSLEGVMDVDGEFEPPSIQFAKRPSAYNSLV